MNANVHTSVGLATTTGVALVVPMMQCKSIADYGLCIGCGIIGALLPDIDANGESKAKKEFRHAMSFLAVVAIYLVYSAYMNGTLLSMISEFTHSIRGIGAIAFLIFCVIGYMSNHREFTHYLIGLLCFTVSFMMLTDIKLGIWFGVGFLSHQLIDMLNKKKIKWLYPLPFDFARYICKAQSKLSSAIGVVSICLFAVFLTQLLR